MGSDAAGGRIHWLGPTHAEACVFMLWPKRPQCAMHPPWQARTFFNSETNMPSCGSKCCLCQCTWSHRKCGRRSGTICDDCRRHYARVLAEYPKGNARYYSSLGILERLEALRAPKCLTAALKHRVRQGHRAAVSAA